MSMRTNADGTIEVNVTMTVQVDPKAWAEYMMGEPEGALQTDVRRDVKRRIRDVVAELAMDEADYAEDEETIPIGTVKVKGIYP